MRLGILVGLSLALAACSSSKSPGGAAGADDAGTSPPDAAVSVLDAPPTGKGIQYRMVSSLEPGQEIERVQFFQVPPEGK